jgi:DNA-binding transcriptional regulator YhcF (GntR family)
MEEELGKKLTVQELATFLGVNEKTVRKHSQELGGIRLGRKFIFFERKVIDALSNEKWEMESPSEKEWKTEREDIQNKERGTGMGKQNADIRRRVGRPDPHNLLD